MNPFDWDTAKELDEDLFVTPEGQFYWISWGPFGGEEIGPYPTLDQAVDALRAAYKERYEPRNPTQPSYLASR